jgi:hypothetical protein
LEISSLVHALEAARACDLAAAFSLQAPHFIDERTAKSNQPRNAIMPCLYIESLNPPMRILWSSCAA